MKTTLRIGFAAAALSLVLGACQGSFGSSGTGVPGGVNPPVNGPGPGQLNPSPASDMTGSPLPSSAPAQNASYPFADAAKGLQCPAQDGYSCTLYFNMSDAQLAALDATPAPKSAKSKGKKATPTPSPTPTPTPSPDPSASASPSGSPSASPSAAAPEMAISLSATPHDAPKMVNPDPKAVATVPLVALRLTTTGDVLINGNTSARFTLPKEQVGGRGFAIQLFREAVKKKGKRTDDFIGSYKQSKLSGNTLVFTFNAPKIQVKKDETWLVVLYGDELPSASTSPGSSASPSSSASPDSAASLEPAASPSSSTAPQASSSGNPSVTASTTP